MTDIFPDQYGNLHGGFDLGMPLTLDIKVDAGDEADPRRQAGAVLGAAHRRRADAQPEPRASTRSTSSTSATPRTFDPVDAPQPIRTTPAIDRFDVEAGRGVDLDQAGAGDRRAVRDDGDRSRHAPRRPVHGPARDAALPVLRDGGNVLAAPRRPASPSPASSPRARSTSNRSTGCRRRASSRSTRPAEPSSTIWIVVRDDRGGESWQRATALTDRGRRSSVDAGLARRRGRRHAGGHVDPDEAEDARPR